MPITYDNEPTATDIDRFFYEGLTLYHDPHTTSAQVKDWWKECERVCRWKLAKINNTVPDECGRVIAPRSAQQPRKKAA